MFHTQPPPPPPKQNKDPFKAGGRTRQSPFASAAAAPPRQGARQSTSSQQQPPIPSVEGQRERSLALVTEGLEGLIPRASQLLKLGGSVFLAFLPFMAAFSALFTLVYVVFGDSFLHGGVAGAGPPPYVDPERLLSETTVDPYITYR